MKKFMSGLAIAAIASTAFVGAASAQVIDTANSGNGGVSNANANGGGVSVGTTNSGGGTGSSTATGGNSGGGILVGGVEVVTGEDIAATVLAALGLSGDE